MTTTRARYTVEAVTDLVTRAIKFDVYDNHISAYAMGTVQGIRVYSMYPTQEAAQRVADALNDKLA